MELHQRSRELLQLLRKQNDQPLKAAEQSRFQELIQILDPLVVGKTHAAWSDWRITATALTADKLRQPAIQQPLGFRPAVAS